MGSQLACDPVGDSAQLADQKLPGWWFGTCFIFPYIGNNHPNWRTHIFQRGRSTTNQLPNWKNSCPKASKSTFAQENCVRMGSILPKSAHRFIPPPQSSRTLWSHALWSRVAVDQIRFKHNDFSVDPTWQKNHPNSPNSLLHLAEPLEFEKYDTDYKLLGGRYGGGLNSVICLTGPPGKAWSSSMLSSVSPLKQAIWGSTVYYMFRHKANVETRRYQDILRLFWYW